MITHNRIGYNGRLGNQMFIYATLVSLREKLGVDIGVPEKNCLNLLNTSFDMYHNHWVQSKCFLYDFFNITAPQIKTEYDFNFIEPKHGYNKELYEIDITKDLSIDGYFQSWKYFDEYKSLLKKEFSIKENQITKVKGLLDNLKNKICIHIRLGDALAHPNIFKLTPDYINKVISEFNDNEYNYIIFCDNFEYIKEWFPEDKSIHFMQYNEIESLYLMTQCDHFIISPSTFSWWGAYLGETDKSKVYTPDWWFGDNRDYTELNLPNWKIVKTS
jgi:hypothetical protein